MLGFVFFLFSFSAFSEDFSYTGELSLELRQFKDDKNRETFDNQRSAHAKFSMEKSLNNGSLKLDLQARYDDQDPERNFIWPQDIYYKSSRIKDYDVLVGYKVFNLSYMEVFNSLDEVNARIYDVSVVNAEKIGELALGLETSILGGDFSFYYLPYRMQPVLPGVDSRANLSHKLNEAVWKGRDSKVSRWSESFLIHFEKSFENLDVQFAFHKGMDRLKAIVGTDDFLQTPSGAVPLTLDFLTPYYFERELSGVGFVYNFEQWQLKGTFSQAHYLGSESILTLEGLEKPFDYTTASVGGEYTFSHSGGVDSTLVLEIQYQESTNEEQRDQLSLQNDAFFNWKVSINDTQSKEFDFSIMRDLEGREEGFYRVSYTQRLLEDLKVETGAIDYVIPEESSSSVYGFFENAGHIFINLIFYM